MGKLRVLSGKEICKILQDNGFTEVRQKGSHIVMQKVIEDSTLTAIVPNHLSVKLGTLMSIIRQSQLPRSLFE
ncbi:MAG: type II toxin-antitoxin system HicA family toxin [Nostocales cyanobacterium LE14-WE4]|uniref:type II toxin-antitoxin system HicA family toxin n=1 Tax=Dolichospermum TaxID=748770 RepID=UPI00232F9C9D|nr:MULTISPECIES: type II toxin-antitoxin system HicA family toxin [Dolichospermum]MCE2697717.1 type II toxin-antitoxin system HicA family toxin [Anabaena sp. 49633_E8]MDJ0499619.1 type II toxin-antitoxin system HicA family toxin [Nostocales cyanobacterium LE14-WE4]MCE2701579.1 type II toxin-antitoxin system HicA family toxin [Anabaena sp. 49633_E8]MDB9439072.1 type II toxin-antitoxin system HicA family toxin [Dolichospermum lemmermannii CS-548]MDB9449314.1 type II toxin-antitoxin system HicA f